MWKGKTSCPTRSIPCYDPRQVSPPLYGLGPRFKDLFNRQLLCLTRYAKWLKDCVQRVQAIHDVDYSRAINALLALVLDWVADKQSTLTRWHTSGEKSRAFSRQALGMVWDYAETGTMRGRWRFLASCLDLSGSEICAVSRHVHR